MTQIHWNKQVNGDFGDAADWKGGVVPGSTDDAIFDAPGTTPYTVTISTDPTVNSLQTTATATLDITGFGLIATAGTGTGVNAGSIRIEDGANPVFDGRMDNTGSISVNASTSFTSLEFGDGPTTLVGGGRVVLGDSVHNFVFGTTKAQLVNVDNTISGAGTLGDGQLTLDNQAKGVIDATGANNPLILDPSGAFTNAGLVEATGAAGMTIENTTINNTGVIGNGGGLSPRGAPSPGPANGPLEIENSTIKNGAGGKVEGNTINLIQVAMFGGEVETDADGNLNVTSGTSEFDETFFINQGDTSIAPDAALAVQGKVENKGSLLLNGFGGSPAGFGIGLGGLFLYGGGAVELTDDDLNRLFFLYAFSTPSGAPPTVTNVDNTISGAGQVGNGQLTLVNEAKGVIDATGTSNGLILDTGAGKLTNAGLIEGTGAAGLVIQNSTASGAGGTIFAGTGSSVTLKSAMVNGGALATAAAGVITIGNGSAAAVQGAIVNAGTIALASTGSAADLRILAAGATLSGGGAVTLAGPASRILGISPTARLTNVDNTIAGVGFVGVKDLTLVNEAAGVIDATGKAGIVLDTAGETLVNAGLLEATGAGSSLVIAGTTVDDSSGGRISAGAGAHVTLQGSQVIGGALMSAGSGVVFVTGAGNAVNGATHTVTLSGQLIVTNGSSLTVEGALDNAGHLQLNGVVAATSLLVGGGALSLTGGGIVTTSNSAANAIFAPATAATLTNLDNKISGAGTLGNTNLTLVNDKSGVIRSAGSTSLVIDTGSHTVVNAGVIAAEAGGGLIVKSAIANSGSLYAITGTLILDGAVTGPGSAFISDGTLDAVSPFSENVTFTGKTGVLELAHSQTYKGAVSGFSLTGGTSFDLLDIAFTKGVTKATFKDNGKHTGGVLTVTDGTHTAAITFVGNYSSSIFTASADGHGGTSIVDPHADGVVQPRPGAQRFIEAAAALWSGAGELAHREVESYPAAPMIFSPRVAAIA